MAIVIKDWFVQLVRDFTVGNVNQLFHPSIDQYPMKMENIIFIHRLKQWNSIGNIIMVMMIQFAKIVRD